MDVYAVTRTSRTRRAAGNFDIWRRGGIDRLSHRLQSAPTNARATYPLGWCRMLSVNDLDEVGGAARRVTAAVRGNEPGTAYARCSSLCRMLGGEIQYYGEYGTFCADYGQVSWTRLDP